MILFPYNGNWSGRESKNTIRYLDCKTESVLGGVIGNAAGSLQPIAIHKIMIECGGNGGAGR